MMRHLLRVSSLLLLSVTTMHAHALGTKANTVVSSTATVDYVAQGQPGTVSASVDFSVDELLDAVVVSLDASNVAVLSPDTQRVLTFRVSNIGNGDELFLLSANAALITDDFDPINVAIWIDSDSNGLFNNAIDVLYNGSNGPLLDGATGGNDDVVVFVVADIPASRIAADIAQVQLTITSDTANTAGAVGNVGAVLNGAGDGGVDAVVGFNGGTYAQTHAYEVINSAVSIVKSVTVNDLVGGNVPSTGATLRYRLDVSVSGAQAVDNLIIVDAIPANTTYQANSLLLNSAAQTDSVDAPLDYADFNISNAGAITVDLSAAGSMSISPPANFVIEFYVVIN
ncbi:MAG: hypothetical protein H0W44_05265 [Gammaproteobacteria bacterium]|nr:hypothetical protein [Gammaproteobacteria bacterium]